MFKVMFFLWRRPDFSHARFLAYYENQHAILGARIVPRPRDYRRNYPLWDNAVLSGRSLAVFGMAPFDVMTELWFADRAGFEAQIHCVTHSPVREELGNDESKFMDRDQQILSVVDEVGASPDFPGHAAIKLVHFARSAPGLTPAGFGTANEIERVPAVRSAIGGLVEYRRNYLLLQHPLSYAGGHHSPARPTGDGFPLDAVEEIWLDDERAVGSAIQTLRSVDGVIDADASFFLVMTEWRSDFGVQAAPLAAFRQN